MLLLMFEKNVGLWKLKKRINKVLNRDMHKKIMLDKEMEYQKDMQRLRNTKSVVTKRKILRKRGLVVA